jgi:hypothetical protein
MRTRIATAAAIAIGGLFAFVLGMGCAALRGGPVQYEFFQEPAQNDAWSPKISGWQRREQIEQRADERLLAPVAGNAAAVDGVPDESESLDRSPASRAPAASQDAFRPEGNLRDKYFDFRADRKRSMAREVAAWIQGQAKQHYVADGAIDHWATLEETLSGDGDDCDGLELLTFHALRDLGFDRSEVYRAIVYRPSDGQHHMVTLWFEDRDDPWVIDPTGAMTLGMPRMSEMPAWVPLKVFSDTVEFTVEPRRDLPVGTSLASSN